MLGWRVIKFCLNLTNNKIIGMSMELHKIVFDTNTLLINPALLRRFASCVIVPKTVFNELDYRKTKAEHQEVAQLALNTIEQLRLPLAIAVQKSKQNDEQILLDTLAVAKNIDVLLVSNDSAMRTRAGQMQVKAVSLEEFLATQSKGDTGLTPDRQILFDCLNQGVFAKADTLIQGSPSLHFNFYLQNGHTPLIEMIRNKQFSAVDYLLQIRGLDLDMVDQAKLNLTAFGHAAQRRQIATLDKLISAGANPHITCRGKNKGNSVLLIAAWDGALNVIRFLAEHPRLKLSLNQADNNGFTPLIKAAIKGHTDIVSYLLSQQVDVHIRDRKDKTALDYAFAEDQQAVVKLLQQG
jgi:ankyrin repeat protein